MTRDFASEVIECECVISNYVERLQLVMGCWWLAGALIVFLGLVPQLETESRTVNEFMVSMISQHMQMIIS